MKRNNQTQFSDNFYFRNATNFFPHPFTNYTSE